jgi:prepilin-type N-terminal cleavage/methylation domain-containing protein
MRPKGCGFTVVELLTVLAIIAILVGILIPTVGYVRNTANEARQKVQLAAIDMALMAFKGDNGDYPRSTLNTVSSVSPTYYCGANMLCEALVGWDLLGFHPDSAWRADGKYSDGSHLVYDTSSGAIDANLAVRKGPYLELGTTNAFKLSWLFGTTSTNLADKYVLCDSFGAKPVTITVGKTVKAGRPILYYKANVASKAFGPEMPANGTDPAQWIYNYTDNIDLINLKVNSEKSNDPLALADPTGSNPLGTYLYSSQYKLKDPKIPWPPWPYRPDSYILISAGADGLYGTQDDICNF